MDVNETRRENLRAMKAELGKGAVGKIAEFAGTDANYISSIIGPNPTRNLGDDLARRIEIARGMPPGTLDLPPGYAVELALRLRGLDKNLLDEVMAFIDFRTSQRTIGSPSYDAMMDGVKKDMKKKRAPHDKDQT